MNLYDKKIEIDNKFDEVGGKYTTENDRIFMR